VHCRLSATIRWQRQFQRSTAGRVSLPDVALRSWLMMTDWTTCSQLANTGRIIIIAIVSSSSSSDQRHRLLQTSRHCHKTVTSTCRLLTLTTVIRCRYEIQVCIGHMSCSKTSIPVNSLQCSIRPTTVQYSYASDTFRSWIFRSSSILGLRLLMLHFQSYLHKF